MKSMQLVGTSSTFVCIWWLSLCSSTTQQQPCLQNWRPPWSHSSPSSTVMPPGRAGMARSAGASWESWWRTSSPTSSGWEGLRREHAHTLPHVLLRRLDFSARLALSLSISLRRTPQPWTKSWRTWTPTVMARWTLRNLFLWLLDCPLLVSSAIRCTWGRCPRSKKTKTKTKKERKKKKIKGVEDTWRVQNPFQIL